MAPNPRLTGINVQLAIQRRDAALSAMDSENAALRDSGFNLDLAGAPFWDRSVWDAYKAQFGRYPWGPYNKPEGINDAPAWAKEICGVRLTPAERMSG